MQYDIAHAVACSRGAAEAACALDVSPCSKCVEWLDDPTNDAFQKRARNGEFHFECNRAILALGGLKLRPRVAKKGR